MKKSQKGQWKGGVKQSRQKKGEAKAFDKRGSKRGRRKIREKKKAGQKNKVTATNKPETPQYHSKINAF